jgi:hypothetical protein
MPNMSHQRPRCSCSPPLSMRSCDWMKAWTYMLEGWWIWPCGSSVFTLNYVLAKLRCLNSSLLCIVRWCNFRYGSLP